MLFNRKSIFVIAVVLLCFIGLWFYFGKKEKPIISPVSTQPELQTTNSVELKQPFNANTNNSPSKPEEMDWSWTNKVPLEKRAGMIDRIKKLMAITSVVNAPIVFYGKVIDQFGQSVDGVRVAVSYNTWSVPNLIEQSPKRQTAHFSSDANGAFVVKDIQGASMTVTLEKEGYELAPHSEVTFAFDPTAQNPHRPNPTKPVVYQMWKRQGAMELRGFYNRGMIPADGKSIWITEDVDKLSRAELPHTILKLTVNREKRVVTFGDKSPYKWGFEINMLGGGIQTTEDAFLYEAPAANYSPKLSIIHEAGDINWLWEQRVVFYFKTSSGKYGHGEVFFSNWQNQEEIYCECSLTWNPDGSRNLESKP